MFFAVSEMFLIVIIDIIVIIISFIVTVFKSICSAAYFNHVLVDNASAVLTCIRYIRINTYLLTYLLTSFRK